MRNVELSAAPMLNYSMLNEEWSTVAEVSGLRSTKCDN